MIVTFREVKPTCGEVEHTYDCGEEVESTFRNDNLTFEELSLTLL